MDIQIGKHKVQLYWLTDPYRGAVTTCVVYVETTKQTLTYSVVRHFQDEPDYDEARKYSLLGLIKLYDLDKETRSALTREFFKTTKYKTNTEKKEKRELPPSPFGTLNLGNFFKGLVGEQTLVQNNANASDGITGSRLILEEVGQWPFPEFRSYFSIKK